LAGASCVSYLQRKSPDALGADPSRRGRRGMNMRRGLLRLWMVATALYAIPALVLFYLAERARLMSQDPFADIMGFPVELYAQVALVALGPPLAALGIGLMAAWVLRGFRQPSP
jgi:hypothetical protein